MYLFTEKRKSYYVLLANLLCWEGKVNRSIAISWEPSKCKKVSISRFVTKLVDLHLGFIQGGHGTGKTGNLVLTFSRQGKHREFCCNTGKVFETQGKYFWLYLLMQKACFSLHIFKIFLPCFAQHNFSFHIIVIWTISTNIFTVPIYLLYCVTFLQVSTKLIQAFLKRNWRNNVIGNMYNYFF